METLGLSHFVSIIATPINNKLLLSMKHGAPVYIDATFAQWAGYGGGNAAAAVWCIDKAFKYADPDITMRATIPTKKYIAYRDNLARRIPKEDIDVMYPPIHNMRAIHILADVSIFNHVNNPTARLNAAAIADTMELYSKYLRIVSAS
jgi:hypothetical protein